MSENRKKFDAPDFERFWAIYPRRVAKKDAEKAWTKLAPDADMVRTVLAALSWQKKSAQWTKDGGAYVPYPATWLRGERWRDEPPQIAKTVYAFECPHHPPCEGRHRCHVKQQLEHAREQA